MKHFHKIILERGGFCSNAQWHNTKLINVSQQHSALCWSLQLAHNKTGKLALDWPTKVSRHSKQSFPHSHKSIQVFWSFTPLEPRAEKTPLVVEPYPYFGHTSKIMLSMKNQNPSKILRKYLIISFHLLTYWTTKSERLQHQSPRSIIAICYKSFCCKTMTT